MAGAHDLDRGSPARGLPVRRAGVAAAGDGSGTEYLLENNTGTFGKPGTLANGYETHQIATTPKFPSEHAIKITTLAQRTGNPNVVYASNTVTGAKKGLTNAPVTK